MRRTILSALLVFIALIGIGCSNSYKEPAPPPPIKAILSQDLIEDLTLPCAPENCANIPQNIEYSIIMDSRIASNSNRSGYLGKNCSTMQNILSCLQTSVSGKTYQGYYTGKADIYETDPVSSQQTKIGVTNYSMTDGFFAQASCAKFPNTDVLPSETIAQIVKDVSEGSVYVYLTDLAMPNVGESHKVVSDLSGVLGNNNLTIGLIGILADYKGTVLDIPISKVGVNLPSENKYQKPVYLLFVGQKYAVFELMDTFLKTSEGNNYLNQPNQVNALYYYKYDFVTKPESLSDEGQKSASVTFNGRLANFATKQDDLSFIFSDSAKDLDEETVLKELSFEKIYCGVVSDQKMANDQDNLQFSFDIPYKIQCTAENAKSQLMSNGGELSLSELSPTLEAESYRIAFHNDANNLVASEAEPVISDELYIDVNTAKIDQQSGDWLVSGNYNASKLVPDCPVIYRIRITFNCKAPSQILEESYDIRWLSEWQMDLDKVQRDWGSEKNIVEILKTPYLSEIFGEPLLNANITAVQDYISDFSTQFINGINFGVVLREQALCYNNSEDWSDNEDFGWAFSKSAVDAMLKTK